MCSSVYIHHNILINWLQYLNTSTCPWLQRFLYYLITFCLVGLPWPKVNQIKKLCIQLQQSKTISTRSYVFILNLLGWIKMMCLWINTYFLECRLWKPFQIVYLIRDLFKNELKILFLANLLFNNPPILILCMQIALKIAKPWILRSSSLIIKQGKHHI